MGALGAELQSAIPHIKFLLSVPPGDEAVLSMDAQQRRLKLFEALRVMMLRGGQRRPLVLVVEDLHWIDKTSEEVLLHLADSLPAAQVLLLVTYRPGYENSFGERTYTTRLGLRTLSDHDSLGLAAGMLAMAEFPSELRDLIIRKAEGNPFFLEEVLKSLLEMGALRQRDGRYILTKPIWASARILVKNSRMYRTRVLEDPATLLGLWQRVVHGPHTAHPTEMMGRGVFTKPPVPLLV